MKTKELIKLLLCGTLLTNTFVVTKSQKLDNKTTPIQAVSLVGEKLIKTTDFSYRLELAKKRNYFDDVICVDFGRTFGLNKQATAIAITTLETQNEQILPIHFDHSDGCKITLNNNLIYEYEGIRKLDVKSDERDLELPLKLDLKLTKGINYLQIELSTNGSEWRFYMQPPTDKGAILKTQIQYPKIGLLPLAKIDAKVAEISNWLFMGPFEKNDNNIPVINEDVAFGKMHKGLNNVPITWTIPKVEVLGNVIDPAPWGTTYQWNYHNGGVAWAMQVLSEKTGNPKFNKWATNFCDFHINGMPFVDYQVNTLNEFKSANHFILNTPLLDFTLAPSLPFIHRLQSEKNFKNKPAYEEFIARMLKYAKKEQIRLPGTNVYTRTTPEIYTTWVDDMFMGIPFLIQAAQYVTDPNEKALFYDDAASQTLEFRKHVWDNDAKLYMHANYSQRPNAKLPYWSRANGWGIWATTEVLKGLPKNHKHYKAILKHFQTHVASLAKLQAPNGFWRNVLNRPDSKDEVSGTAIFTLAIARGITEGWLDREKYLPVVQNSWNAIQTQIDADGTVHNICMGTMCSEDVDYYMNRPFFVDDTHGTFAVIFAGIEMQNLLDKIEQEKANKVNMAQIIDQSLKFATQQSIGLAEKLMSEPKRLPRTIDKDGKLLTSDEKWWTSGFFPGTLWYLYEYSKDPKVKAFAENYSERVKNEQYTTDNHDVGFMIYCSYGNAYRLDPKPEYKPIIINAAKSLSTRFNHKLGLIKSWDWGKWQFPVIIDNMMNLELLFNATRFTGDSSFHKIAVTHATVNMEHHFRSDASCYHVVSYDTITGLPEHKGTWQGHSHNSSWARGQAWALYGYTLTYRETKDPKFLEMATRIADFMLHHPRMPKDLVPYWDYDAPRIPNESRDVSTASVMCSALIELSDYVKGEKSKTYLDAARRQIVALSSPKYLAKLGENGNFVLKYSVGSMPHKAEVDVPLTYADYYYIEAMLRYRNKLKK